MKGSTDMGLQDMSRTVSVLKVSIPVGSSIGYGQGVDIETGEVVSFMGDYRPMRDLGEEVANLANAHEGTCTVFLEDWQLLCIHPAGIKGGF